MAALIARSTTSSMGLARQTFGSVCPEVSCDREVSGTWRRPVHIPVGCSSLVQSCILIP
jgi:hypothetical protein